MRNKKVSLSGLTNAFLSGYKYLYIPMEQGNSVDDYYATVYSCAKRLGMKIQVVKKLLVDEDSPEVMPILLIKIIGIDPDAEVSRLKKRKERDENIIRLAKLIKKLNSKGENYQTIAGKLGYKSATTVVNILKEEQKILNRKENKRNE